MKKIICSALSIFFSASILCGQTKEIYTHPQFDSIAKAHTLLAVLPFDVTIRLRPREMKRLKEGELEKLEKTEGKSVQSALEAYFLKLKDSENFKINFQDISKTNSLLAKAGWTADSLGSKTKEEICKQLDVDGVISGTLITDKPLSAETSAALGTVLTIVTLGTWWGGVGPTNSGKCTINVHERTTSELIWKYEKTLSRGLGSDMNSVINAMMRKASKKFPYENIK